jgi:hypothetical protein
MAINHPSRSTFDHILLGIVHKLAARQFCDLGRSILVVSLSLLADDGYERFSRAYLQNRRILMLVIIIGNL